MNVTLYKELCKKHNTHIDFLGNIYVLKDGKLHKIGRIYYKEKHKLFHSELISGEGIKEHKKNLEGKSTFEEAFINLLKSTDFG